MPLSVRAQTNSAETPPPADTTAPTVPASPETAATLPAVTNVPDASPAQPPQIDPTTIGNQNHAAPQEEIVDIRPPIFFLHSWLWLWIALAGAATVALIILLWMWFKPNRVLSAKNAYELTLEKLEKARAMIREDNAMPYAVFVSETIRSYLGQRFQTPSTRRTTEEFLQLMQADLTAPLAEHRLLLWDFLKKCDQVKFGRYQPTLIELEQVQQHAFNFVTATKPVPLADTANGRSA